MPPRSFLSAEEYGCKDQPSMRILDKVGCRYCSSHQVTNQSFVFTRTHNLRAYARIALAVLPLYVFAPKYRCEYVIPFREHALLAKVRFCKGPAPLACISPCRFMSHVVFKCRL